MLILYSFINKIISNRLIYKKLMIIFIMQQIMKISVRTILCVDIKALVRIFVVLMHKLNIKIV